MKDILRGEIYYADLSPTIGREQGGVRPVLIVQNDVGNTHSDTTIIIAITSNLDKTHLPTHVIIDAQGLSSTSLALAEQIKTIDKIRLGSYIDRLNDYQMRKIDTALRNSLDLHIKEVKKHD